MYQERVKVILISEFRGINFFSRDISVCQEGFRGLYLEN